MASLTENIFIFIFTLIGCCISLYFIDFCFENTFEDPSNDILMSNELLKSKLAEL